MAELGPMLVVLFFSVVVHECAHGYVALRCGDPTARLAGRLTLNPLPHVDPIGTVLFPLLLVLSNTSLLFGWAKPVPVNPANFRNPAFDNVKVSAAGPASNLILGFAFAVVGTWLPVVSPGAADFLGPFFRYGVYINAVLAVFNLVPIPPLDGSHLLEYVLPRQWAWAYHRLRPYGFLLLILFMVTPMFGVVRLGMRAVLDIYDLLLSLLF